MDSKRPLPFLRLQTRLILYAILLLLSLMIFIILFVENRLSDTIQEEARKRGLAVVQNLASMSTNALITYNYVVLHPPFLQVSIDIKPGGINLRKTHQISVAIFSTGDFDAPSQIDQDSLTFGRTGSEHSLAYCNKKPKDIDGDGFKDLLCYFYTDRTAFQCGDNLGALNGYMVGGLPIRGSESVNIVPCK